MSEVVETTEVVAEGPISPEVEAAEPKPEQQAEAPKQDDRFASKFAALSRKEKQIKAYETQFKAREAELAKKEQELAERLKAKEEELGQYKSKYERLKTPESALKALEEEGLTYEQLTKMQLNEQNPTPEMLIERMQKQLDDKYQKQIEELKQQLEEKEESKKQQTYEQAKAQYMQNISAHIDADPDSYELIKYNNASNLVYEVVEEFYNTNKKVLDIKDAADMVEKHLEQEASKILKLKKLQQTASKPAEAIKPAPKAAPTLSNSLSAERPTSGSKQLSDEESKAQAAKLIRWMD